MRAIPSGSNSSFSPFDGIEKQKRVFREQGSHPLDRDPNLPLVLEEEWSKIQELQDKRHSDGKANVSDTFALAFSGGGMRAAAFQCGVLWRLAEMNLLKDVTYFTAVSGGGYISSAFSTHCYQAWKDEPPSEGCVKSWYLMVVARTIVRMQQNSGNFVRDFVRSGWGAPDDNSGCMPLCWRVMDVPILLCTLGITMAAHPVFAFLAFMLPVTSMTEEYFGQDMRRSFCNELVLLDNDPQHQQLLYCIAVSFLFTVFLFFIRKIIPCLKDPLIGAEPGSRVPLPCTFLVAHCLHAFMLRVSIVLISYYLILLIALETQKVAFLPAYELGWKHHYCKKKLRDCLSHPKGCLPSVSIIFPYVLVPIFLVAICLMPYVGSTLLLNFVCVLGPFLLALIQVRLIQFRVFGELTGQDFFLGIAFSKEGWDLFRRISTIVLLFLIPFYPEFRRVLHTYYMRVLSHNFFAKGEDFSICELAKCPYCPFNIVTGTASDYQAPIAGTSDALSEISFSPLHVGSLETGFVRMPVGRSIGKCTALTAAGCVDAAALTLSKLLTLRFYLEILNLSWGDYMLFEEEWKPNGPLKKLLGLKGEGATRLARRLPSTIVIVVVYILVLFDRLGIALLIFTAMFFFSFFSGSFRHLENFLCYSPFFRQLLQFGAFKFRGEKPPPMLYITDGGCRDCTTLMQLVLRRQTRILMVLAASDPTDDLAVLRVALGMAKNAKLAKFYNPLDPRNDVDAILDDFKNDKTVMYLHIGILYPDIGAGSSHGQLFILKNRLPDDGVFRPRRIEPHITAEEVQGEASRGNGPTPPGVMSFEEQHWDPEMHADALGPLCCCDCSHYKGVCNCGPTWPHGSFSNFMYMTPMWCSSLTRLAYDVSVHAVDAMRSYSPEPWETQFLASRSHGNL